MNNTESKPDYKRRFEKEVAASGVAEFLKFNPQFTTEQAQERISQATEFVARLPYNPLQDEIDDRHYKSECTRMTMKGLNQRLKEIGYRLDRSSDCRSMSRWMTGARAGKSYPCVSMRPVQIDDGMSFAHYQARRDDNFTALQAMRGQVYVVGKNAIYEI